MVYYIIKDISPLRVIISKLIFEEQNFSKNEINIINPFTNIKETKSVKTTKTSKTSKTKKSKKEAHSVKNKKQLKSKKGAHPPKKGQARRVRHNSGEKRKDTEEVKLIDIVKKKKVKKQLKRNIDSESVKSDKIRKRKSIIDYEMEKQLKILDTKANLETMNSIKYVDQIQKSKKEDSDKKIKSDEDELGDKILDHYELNNLEYLDAVDFDKRGFCKTYWSVLLREHYVLFTFVAWNDYNLFYVKIERFFILICTEMTMNGLFFVHESMHRKYVNGEELTFVQKIPQLLFTLIASHIIEVILCYLSMTDRHVYEIKALQKKEKNDERIFDILKWMKTKLIIFFIFTVLLFLFHWYFISAFCAVYQNTQVIFLRDSAISILISLIDPFIIYAFDTLLRFISLMPCLQKKAACLYKMSDLLPIF